MTKRLWEVFQPNPTESKYKSTKGDCSTRCLCGALGLDWQTAFKLQCEEALKQYNNTASVDVLSAILESHGFKRVGIKRERGKSAPTPLILANRFPGKTMVCQLSNHMVAIKGGKYLDTWDCGDKTVYAYWVKD